MFTTLKRCFNVVLMRPLTCVLKQFGISIHQQKVPPPVTYSNCKHKKYIHWSKYSSTTSTKINRNKPWSNSFLLFYINR